MKRKSLAHRGISYCRRALSKQKQKKTAERIISDVSVAIADINDTEAINRLVAEWNSDTKKYSKNYKQDSNQYKALEIAGRMIEAKESLGVQPEEFFQKKMYELSLLQILEAKATAEEEEYKQALMECWVGKYGLSESKAREEVERVRNVTGLDYEFISTRTMFLEPDNALLKIKKKENRKRQKKALETDDGKKYRKLDKKAVKAGIDVVDFYKTMKLRCTKFGEIQRNYLTLRHYEKTDEAFSTFITCSDKYYLMRKYNGKGNTAVLNEKSVFAEKYGKYFGRKHWTSNENGTLEEFSNFVEGQDAIFVKPIESNQGRGSRKISIGNNVEAVFKEIMEDNTDVIAEQYIYQHPTIAQFGGGCVNTVRVVTITDDDGVNVIYAVLRIGSNSFADNFHNGGMIVEIDLSDGTMISDGFDAKGKKVEIDPFHNSQIKGCSIPFWNEICDLINSIANELWENDKVGYVGWDVAITKDGPIIVEGNAGPMLNLIEYVEPFKSTGRRNLVEKFLQQ